VPRSDDVFVTIEADEADRGLHRLTGWDLDSGRPLASVVELPASEGHLPRGPVIRAKNRTETPAGTKPRRRLARSGR